MAMFGPGEMVTLVNLAVVEVMDVTYLNLSKD
jgi:hypothetical protein